MFKKILGFVGYGLAIGGASASTLGFPAPIGIAAAAIGSLILHFVPSPIPVKQPE